MSWVAIDRAMRLAIKRSLPAPLRKWHDARDLVAGDIWKISATQSMAILFRADKGRRSARCVFAHDAARALRLGNGSGMAEDPGRDRRIPLRRRHDLPVPKRRRLEGGEGAFTTCTFWYVECLARAGRLDQARLAMGQGMSRANHLGLFSEELDKRGRQLGNFPQVLTHLAFISAAHFLNRRLDQPSGGEWQP
jgi:GH15 family glucan-1,4-alpha-glucosidase